MKNNWVDFKAVKDAVSMQKVLEHYQVNWLRKEKQELVGRCPIHKGEGQDTFHVSLSKNVFQCFHAACAAHGNHLDLWAAVHHLPLYEAALHLAETFHLRRNREEEPVTGTR